VVSYPEVNRAKLLSRDKKTIESRASLCISLHCIMLQRQNRKLYIAQWNLFLKANRAGP